MIEAAGDSFADEASQTDKLSDESPKSAAKELDHAKVLKRGDRAYNRDKANIDRAFEAASFSTGETQWLEEHRALREADSRPVLTFNQCGQFVRRVTGEQRKMTPAIKVVPVDDGATEDVAEIRAGLIRYIENRSDASKFVYPTAADSQVACGIGHIEILGELSDSTTFEQELRLRVPDDQISILWDPDAKLPTREDAIFCFQPVDMTKDAYEEAYPNHAVSDMGMLPSQTDGYSWFPDEIIRVARYWYKVKIKRKLMKMPNGGYEDLTDAEQDELARLVEQGGKLVERQGHQVRWVIMNGKEFLTEPKDWPGRYIPLVPVLGEEIRVGARVVRNGIIHAMMDAQIAYNAGRSTEVELLGLQPKSPYIGTEKNFKDHPEWGTANVKNWPWIAYTPDSMNGGARPQREPPPQGSAGLSEAITRAQADMQAVTGIYPAALGDQSNETSGVAIERRAGQSETGTFVYLNNFALSITHVARVLNDLLPHYYDTARTIRIIGKDDTEVNVQVNQPTGVMMQGMPAPPMLNDLTTGAYDIRVKMGPSYDTQRQEAREGMTAFVQAFPPAGPLIADKIAKAQDWPDSEDVAERLETLLPPPIQAKIAEKKGLPPQPPPPPDPMVIAQAEAELAKAEGEKAKAQSTMATAQSDVLLAQLKVKNQELMNVKAEFEVLDAQARLGQNGPPLDAASLHEQLRLMNDALEMLGMHAAGQVGPSAMAQEMTPNVAGEAKEPKESPEPSEDAKPPPALPKGHYAAMPEQGAT